MERESMTVKDLIDFLEHKCFYDDIVYIGAFAIPMNEDNIYRDDSGVYISE